MTKLHTKGTSPIVVGVHVLRNPQFEFGGQSSFGPAMPVITSNSNPDRQTEGRRPNGFRGLSLNDRTILFLVTSLDMTVSVG